MGIFEEFSNARYASKVRNAVAQRLGVPIHILPMELQTFIFEQAPFFRKSNCPAEELANLVIENMNTNKD
jgi:hypothetical protein